MIIVVRNYVAFLLAVALCSVLATPLSAQDLQPKKTGLPGRTVWALATTGTSSVITFAATDKGLWRSGDNGTSWTETSLKNIAVYAVKSRDIGRTSTLLVGTDRGVLRSTDGGNTWSSPEVTTGTAIATSNIVSLKKVFDIEIVRPGNGNGNGNADFWFAATEKGVYRSTNDGRSWSLVNIDRTADNNEVRGITVDGNTVIVNLWKEGLWRSTNSGNSWTKLTIAGESALCRSVFVHQATNATVWLAGAVSGNLWRSTNSGNSWSKVATSSSVQRSATANTFAGIDALTALGKALIAGTVTGLALSVDDGITWKQMRTASPKPISLMSDGRSLLYVGVDNSSGAVTTTQKSPSAGLTAEGDGVGTYQIAIVTGFSATPILNFANAPVTLDFYGSNLDVASQVKVHTNINGSGAILYTVNSPMQTIGSGNVQLRTAITIATPGQYYISLCIPHVANGELFCDYTAPSPLTVNTAPLPLAITSISPNTIQRIPPPVYGGPSVTSPEITINGTGFVNGVTRVYGSMNGEPRVQLTASSVSSNAITLTLNLSTFNGHGTITITVEDDDSAPATGTISVPNAVPIINSVSPTTLIRGTNPAYLDINGAGFYIPSSGGVMGGSSHKFYPGRYI